MADNKDLTKEFMETIKQAKEQDQRVINALLAGMNLQRELDGNESA